MAKAKKEYKVNEALRRARLERGWTQEELAKQMDVSVQAVGSWERQEHFPFPHYRARLSTVLGKTFEELNLHEIPAESQADYAQEITSSHLQNGRVQLETTIETETQQEHREGLDQKPKEDSHFIEQLEPDKKPVMDQQSDGNLGSEKKSDQKHSVEQYWKKQTMTTEVVEEKTPESSVHSFINKTASILTRKDDKNRSIILKRVKEHWISSLLHVISTTSLLTLDLQMLPDAVVRPWGIQMPTAYPDSWGILPSGTMITEVHHSADGALLILGEPGAGKTTLLLELTRDWIEYAQKDNSQPIPFPFKLSYWSQRDSSFEEWLIQQLRTTYSVPKEMARQWVSNDHIFPLLDGLDEVKPQLQAACVEAINVYRQEHGFTPIVVTCRSSVYDELPQKLTLTSAVIVKPLTTQQIDEYIQRGGEHLAEIRKILQTDPSLREMASAPLMLNILTQAYEDMSGEEILQYNTVEQRRHVIFKRYVQRVLERKPIGRYSNEQTIEWLSWLAYQMRQHDQTVFYVERIQPDWLEKEQQVCYRNILIRILIGLNVFLNSALLGCFRSDSVPNEPGLFYWLGGKGLGNSILGWMSPGIGSGLRGGGSLGIVAFIVDVIIGWMVVRNGLVPVTKQSVQRGLFNGFLHGAISGSITAVIAYTIYASTSGFTTGIYRAIGIGIFCGVLFGLLAGFTAYANESPQPSSSSEQWYHWFLPGSRSFLKGFWGKIGNFSMVGLAGAIGIAGTYALQAGRFDSMALGYGLLVGVSTGILFGLGKGTKYIPELGTKIRPVETLTWSWEQVWKHSKTTFGRGLAIGLAIMIPSALTLGCASGFFYGAPYGIAFGLTYGSTIGIVSAVASILVGMLNSGWSPDILPGEQHTQPNEGITHSFRHAFFAASLFGLIGGGLSGLACGLSFRLSGIPGWFTLTLGFILVYSVIFTFRLWVAYGGKAGIEHYVLRWSLRRAGHMPLDMVDFLNRTKNTGLLIKVGGGYIFAHGLLRDYFANLYSSSHNNTTRLETNKNDNLYTHTHEKNA